MTFESTPMSAPLDEAPGRTVLRLTGSSGWSTLGMEANVQTRCFRKEGVMAIKVLIKRRVSTDKAREMITLFRQMRMLATAQEGYISGETLHARPASGRVPGHPPPLVRRPPQPLPAWLRLPE